MRYIKKGRFSLREEYVCHTIGVVCVVIMVLPFWVKHHDPGSSYASVFRDIKYIWIVKTAFISWAITSFYLAFIILKQYFIINNNPIAKINSAAQGYAAIEGIQACLTGKPLTSPISNTPCTWYSYVVEEYKQQSFVGGRKYWTVIKNEESDEHFTLTDTTGRCVVYPESADIFPNVYETWYDKSWFAGRKYRYTEQLLIPNTRVYIVGVFRTIIASIADTESKEQREEVLNILKAWKKDYKLLLQKFDTNKDGTIDSEEWDKVVKCAEEQISQKYPTVVSGKSHSINIISKDGLMSNQPFIISALRKKDVANKFYFKFIFHVSLFMVAIITAFTLDRWYTPILSML